ncbi:MAG: glycosyltransferase family 2 protein [Lachnospiraceae bacterium]|nr:glycosyltransferase family 2 protein [Lachnospiraceae bacterium]
MDLVSVIIPAYNVEATIADCIGSVTSQDYQNIEIIVINDGSSDRTEDIVMQLAKEDSRIRLLTTPNGGVSHARNTGLSLAEGEYLMFVDADDLLLDHAISRLVKAQDEVNADLVVASYILVNATTGEEHTVHLTEQRRITKEEAHAFFLTEGLNLSQPWGKLYRRELFDGVRYPIGKLYEDISVIASLVEGTESVRILDAPVISYRQSLQSISHTTNIERQMDGLQARRDNYVFYSIYYPTLKGLAADATVYYGYYLLGRIVNAGLRENREYYEKTCEMIRESLSDASLRGFFMKTATFIFMISPRLLAQLCDRFSKSKNGV